MLNQLNKNMIFILTVGMTRFAYRHPVMAIQAVAKGLSLFRVANRAEIFSLFKVG